MGDSDNPDSDNQEPETINFFHFFPKKEIAPKETLKQPVENLKTDSPPPKYQKPLRDNVRKALSDLKTGENLTTQPPLKKIKAIRFGVLGPDEIKGIASCRITKSNIASPFNETVYDERMGPSDIKGVCTSCSQPIRVCPGHFGYIELATPVINPQFIKTIVTILNCICLNCSHIRLSKEELELELKTDSLKNISIDSIIKICSESPYCTNCDEPNPQVIQQDAKIVKLFSDKSGKKKTLIPVDELLSILKKISNEDLELMGFNLHFRNCSKHDSLTEKLPSFRPEYLILTRLPVLPSVSRPPNFEGGMKNNDDLTSSYIEIIKNNQKIYECTNEKDREDRINSLESYICSFIDNTDEATKHTSGKPIKSIKERLAGKDALIRGKMLGKRVDVSARSVITADTTLDIDEIGIPIEICKILTKPEKVTSRNIIRLTGLLKEGKVNMVERGGKKYMIMSKITEINYGDIIYRHLQDGDDVVVNRQPTLHRGGIMGARTKMIDGKTIRLNVCITAPLGADFKLLLSL
jgi:DNA-directed RNA polymerase beta' subunit